MKVREVMRIFLDSIHAGEVENTVDYVCGGGEALPLPLSPEEEAKMVCMLFGTPDEAEEAKSVLIQRNLRLVV